MGIERPVNDSRWDVRDLARLENAELGTHPLLSLALDDIDDLIAVRVIVKRMTPHGIHVRPDQQQFIGSHETGPAKPFVIGPRAHFADRIRNLNKGAWAGVHEGNGRSPNAIVFQPQGQGSP